MKSMRRKKLGVIIAILMVCTLCMPAGYAWAAERTVFYAAGNLQSAPAAKVKLSATKATVIIGSTLTLTVKNLDESQVSAIKWKSNRPSIAKVNQKGVVTPVKAGTTTIKCTITYKDKTTQTLSCTVTVKKRVKATAVTINNTEKAASIKVGERLTLKSTLSPANTTDQVYWFSSNKAVATVGLTSGKVTAKKEGTVVITAKVGLDKKGATAKTNKVVTEIKIEVKSEDEPLKASLNYSEQENITNLKVVDSSYYYSVKDVTVMDTYGNTYTKVGTFSECGTHHATYYTAGKYVTLYGTIAAPDSIGGDAVAITVNIYADDKLIQTIPSITRLTKPVDVALDITDADTVKIEAVTTNVYPTGILFKLNVSTGTASPLPNYMSSLNYNEQENITNLKVVDSSYYYSVKNAAIMDTYGNTYTKVGTFSECGTHHAIYYTAKKFTSLTGTIAALDSIGGEGVVITVNIYADDKLIYTIPSITRTTKPIVIDLDISSADTIKIEAITTNIYPTGILFRMDVS